MNLDQLKTNLCLSLNLPIFKTKSTYCERQPIILIYNIDSYLIVNTSDDHLKLCLHLLYLTSQEL